MTKDKLIKHSDITISALLHKIHDNWREGLTGLFSLERKDAALTLGHLVQRTRNGNRIQSIMDTWDRLVESGRIKEGYEDSDQSKDLLQELLAALDNDLLDETIFNALKKIFLVTSSEKLFDRYNIEPLEYLRLCRKMTSGEILLLLVNYNICKNNDEWKAASTRQPISVWIDLVKAEPPLKLRGLILLHEQGLMEKHLLSDRSGDSYVGFDKKTFRLTDLGYAFCEYIEQYDILFEDDLEEED